MKVIILGLDGMTMRIVKPYVDAHLLPNFQKVMAEGFHGRLRSTIPPVTGPGWASLATGKEPGKHGIFEFRKREGYTSRFLTKNTSIHAEPLWNILSRNGRQAIVINVPMTYPPDELNGIMISGLMTPGIESPFTYPADIKREIFEIIPNYKIDIDEKMFLISRDKDQFLKAIKDLTKDRRRLMNHFIDHKPWDLFFATFVGVDRIQHFFWDEILSKAPNCVAYYQLLDDILGDILKRMDEETMLFVVSDHGFTDGRRAFCINSFFREMGLATLKSQFNAQKRLAKIGMTGDSIKGLLHKIGLIRLKECLPLWVLNHLKKFIPNKSSIENEIDWTRTKVFSLFGYGLIHINLVGREPQGIVTKDEYKNLCTFIKERLLEVEDPATGRKIVRSVFLGSEIYNTTYGHELPDLIILCHDGFSVVTEFWKDIVTDTRFGNLQMTGNHDLDGICMAYGKSIEPTEMDAQIYDILPTVLYSMDIGIPADVDGRVLTEIFSKEFIAKTTLHINREKSDGLSGKNRLSKQERETLEQQLKNLGYMA